MVPDASRDLSRNQIAAGGLEEFQHRRVFERRRIGEVDHDLWAGHNRREAFSGPEAFAAQCRDATDDRDRGPQPAVSPEPGSSAPGPLLRPPLWQGATEPAAVSANRAPEETGQVTTGVAAGCPAAPNAFLTGWRTGFALLQWRRWMPAARNPGRLPAPRGSLGRADRQAPKDELFEARRSRLRR